MTPTPNLIQIVATVFFVLAVIHTFTVKWIYLIGNMFPRDSLRRNLFRLLSQVEVVFGLWGVLFIIVYTIIYGPLISDQNGNIIGGSIFFVEGLNFREPAFVFVIMTVAASRPIVKFAEYFIKLVGKIIPTKAEKISFYFATMTVGPILGSLITEPAAMTVTALILKEYFYDRKHMSKSFMYSTLGLLFVNVSIGGSLTAFAAPPILMAAEHLGWNSWFVFTHIGWKSIIAIIISTSITLLMYKKELAGKFRFVQDEEGKTKPTSFVTIIHLLFLLLIIYLAKYSNFFIITFIVFVGFTTISNIYQEKNGLNIKEPMYVAFFLGGILTLGSMQDWWLQLLLSKMGDILIYLGTAFLTTFTDNAALTYLGSLVDLGTASHLKLVSAALAGGGMTVIANAPNPAGYGILKKSFGTGVNPVNVFLGALIPTVITLIILYF